MTAPPLTLLQVVALPELATEILKYLWPKDLLRLRLVSKAFSDLCHPYFELGILYRNLQSHPKTILGVLSINPHLPPKRVLPLLHYVTALSPQTQQADDLVMASPNMHGLTIRPGHDDGDNMFTWFLTHEYSTYPHVRTLRIDANAHAQNSKYSINKILRPGNKLHIIFPNVDTLRILDAGRIDFWIFIQALEDFPMLKTVHVQAEVLEVLHGDYAKFDAKDKVFPNIESLEVVNKDWVPFPNGWKLMDLLPNLKHLNINLDSLPRHAPSQQQQKEQGPRFPSLTSLTTTVSIHKLSQFYELLGLPSTWTLPTAPTNATFATQYPFRPPPPPRRKLCIDIVQWPAGPTNDAVSDALTFCGISLQDLSQNNLSRFFIAFLRKPCCRELKILSLADKIPSNPKGQNLNSWDFLILLTAPTPVTAPTTTTTATTTLMTSDVIAAALMSHQQQLQQTLPVNTPYVPLASIFTWTKTLTELRLGFFEVENYANQPIISKLNTLLRLLPNLVIFALSHVLGDLDIFKSMGRIPVSRLKAESEFFQQQYGGGGRRAAEEKERDGDGSVVDLADALGSVTIGEDGEKYVLIRPLLERVEIQLKEGLSLVEIKKDLLERFPLLSL